MSPQLSYDEIVNGLVARNVPRAKAESQAAQEIAARGGSVSIPNSALRELERPGFVAFVGKPLLFPIRLVLPWSALCSDNSRTKASMVRVAGGETKPRSLRTAEYKAAAEKIRVIARAAMTVDRFTFPAITHPVSLLARVFTPTQRRVDVSNFAKGVQDALSKIVYRDDAQLEDVRWVKAAQDIDHPRVEIEIAPL